MRRRFFAAFIIATTVVGCSRRTTKIPAGPDPVASALRDASADSTVDTADTETGDASRFIPTTVDAGVVWFRAEKRSLTKPEIALSFPVLATPAPAVNKAINDELARDRAAWVKAFEKNYRDNLGSGTFAHHCQPTLIAPLAVSVLCEVDLTLGMWFQEARMFVWVVDSGVPVPVRFDDVFDRTRLDAMLGRLRDELAKQPGAELFAFEKDDGGLYDIIARVPEHFAANREGLTFVFPHRVVGIGAAGCFTVHQRWDDLRPFAKKGGRFEDLERAARDPAAHGVPYDLSHSSD